MKASKGKTVITVETFQRTTIRSRKTAERVLCAQCAAEILIGPPAAHEISEMVSAKAKLLGPGQGKLMEKKE